MLTALLPWLMTWRWARRLRLGLGSRINKAIWGLQILIRLTEEGVTGKWGALLRQTDIAWQKAPDLAELFQGML